MQGVGGHADVFGGPGGEEVVARQGDPILVAIAVLAHVDPQRRGVRFGEINAQSTPDRLAVVGRVVGAGTIKHILASTTEEGVVVEAAHQDVVAVPAEEQVAARQPFEKVVATATEQQIQLCIEIGAGDCVIAATTVEVGDWTVAKGVGNAAAAGQGVVAATPGDGTCFPLQVNP